MRDTQCLEETGAAERHAAGYEPVYPDKGKPASADQPIAVMANSLLFGAGNLLSTGGDLVRWTTALHHRTGNGKWDEQVLRTGITLYLQVVETENKKDRLSNESFSLRSLHTRSL